MYVYYLNPPIRGYIISIPQRKLYIDNDGSPIEDNTIFLL